MKLKPLFFSLTAMLALAVGMQQPVFAAKQAKASSSSTHHHKKQKQPQKVLCTKDRKKHKACESFKHNIQLQLSDAYGFPVVGTEFWVTVDVIKEGPKVTIQLPLINFQTGPCSNDNPACPTFPPGGYVYTSSGFLPQRVRPTDLVPPSIVAASNNGLSPVFSFVEPLPTPPPAGYIVQVTNAGALQVQCAGTFGNVIPEGPQILMPCSITYFVKKQEKLCKNIVLSDGATSITQFTNTFGNAVNNFRDSHVNDAFDGVVAWAWADNSMVADKTNGTLNAMVCIGKTDKHGNLKVGKPIQLTDLPPFVQTWCSAVTIVRDGPSKGNIVVSYGLFDYTQLYLNRPNNPLVINFCSCHAVSTDGGETWANTPYEYTAFYGSIAGNVLTVTDLVYGSLAAGQAVYTYTALLPDPGILPGTTILFQLSGTPGGAGTYQVSGPAQNTGPNYTVALPETILTPMQPSNSIGGGDERGVSSDKFGNVWYGTTIAFPNGVFDSYTNQPIFTVSTDGGVTFETTPVYSVPLPNPVPPVTKLYDFPQYCFGGRGDGSGEYGLWFSVDYWENGIDSNPIVGFIPIYGLGSFGVGTEVNLTGLTNVDLIPSITASEDGRVWTQCIPYSGATYISPIGTVFKSPGELDENYAGPGNIAMINQNQLLWGVTNEISAPVSGFFNSVQQNVYDDKRQALYSIVTNQVPDYSQNMGIFLSISRDNGQTWSEPILINNTNFANRGFASMALDTVKGNLVFGWYDGRNDKTYESVEYMGAVLPAKTLDKLVNSIPLSNPLYMLPPATTPPFATAGVSVKPAGEKQGKKRAERTFGRRQLSKMP